MHCSASVTTAAGLRVDKLSLWSVSGASLTFTRLPLFAIICGLLSLLAYSADCCRRLVGITLLIALRWLLRSSQSCSVVTGCSVNIALSVCRSWNVSCLGHYSRQQLAVTVMRVSLALTNTSGVFKIVPNSNTAWRLLKANLFPVRAAKFSVWTCYLFWVGVEVSKERSKSWASGLFVWICCPVLCLVRCMLMFSAVSVLFDSILLGLVVQHTVLYCRWFPVMYNCLVQMFNLNCEQIASGVLEGTSKMKKCVCCWLLPFNLY